jgi:exo-1,4-beta-D-glucosaminidase
MSAGRVGVVLWVVLAAGCGGGGNGANPFYGAQNPSSASRPEVVVLKEGWMIRSSEGLQDAGDEISRSGYPSLGWYPAAVPSTVFAALVDNGVYPDPFYGMNMSRTPGSWPPFLDVSLLPMPPGSPYVVPWWYRTEFAGPPGGDQRIFWLRLEGINFRANVWLNGRLLADSRQVAGTFREYEFNVTDWIMPGRTNCLALEVFSPTPHDLAYNWVDWNPTPPDKNMGIYREVKILTTGPVALRHPQVVSRLDLPGLDRAELTIAVDLLNAKGQPVSGVLQVAVEGEQISVAKNVSLGPFETEHVVLQPGEFPQLVLKRPRIWWPAGLGTQELYRADIMFSLQGRVSDRQSVSFGIRDIRAPLTEEGFRLFQVNGQNILIRGGGWAPDLLLRSSPERLEAEIRCARDIGLNAIRLEGKPEVDEFYDLCDRYGIFVMAGWCCCDHWQFQEDWDDEDRLVAAESLKCQARHLRNHPSTLVWLNGSDDPPQPDIERMYIGILEEQGWPVPYLSSADDQPSLVSGPSGVKMTGPYEYVPPEYWLADTRYGGAFGFNTETSPGESIPVLESLKKFLPEDHLWPPDLHWIYHAGRGWYMTIAPFVQAMNRRYGSASGLEEFVMKAQVLAYDNHRAMFEAYGRNKYRATGVIQWMMNNAWPSLIWHLYDYYLRPGGAYFGAKKALEMLHVQYSYDDRSIVVVNGFYEPFGGMSVTARVFDIEMRERYRNEARVDIPPDSSVRAFSLPLLRDTSSTYFLQLELRDRHGEVASRNFYWLSTEPVIFAWDLTDDRLTPVLHEADLTLLSRLEQATVECSVGVIDGGGEETGWGSGQVVVENTGSRLAFFLELRLADGAGDEEVVPLYWEDNYISLLPHERREISFQYRSDALRGRRPVVEIRGWNVPAGTCE